MIESSEATPATHGMSRTEWIVLGLSAVWLTALLLLEWPALFWDTFESRVSIDSAVFGYAGELLRTGGRPYLSYWDHKGPLIHLINAAGLSLSGGRVWGVWLASFATLMAALGLGYAVLRRAFGAMGAVLGTTLFVVALPSVHASNLTEAYALPLQWAAVLLFLLWITTEGRHFRLGLGLGILATLGVLLRANLIGGPASVGVVLSILLLGERRFGAWLRVLAGGLGGVAIVGAAIVGHLALEGALAAFWDQVFHYNFLYAGSNWKAQVMVAYRGLRYATDYAPLVFPLAGWLYAAYRLWTRRLHDPLYPVLLLCLVWLPVELLLASMAGRSFDHYFTTLLGPLAFLTAMFGAEIVPQLSRESSNTHRIWSKRALVLVLAAGLALPRLGDTAEDLQNQGLTWWPRTEQISATVAYIRAHSSADETLFVWGHAPDLYFFSGRRAASRFIYPGPLLTPGYADALLIRGFLDELRANAPSLVIDASRVAGLKLPIDIVPPLATWDPEWHVPTYPPQGKSQWSMTPELKAFYDFIARNYTPVDTVGPVGWTVYRRSATPNLAAMP